MSRKQKGSNNRYKARLKVAKLHEKITNQRKDFLHKLSTKLIRENQSIAIEDLKIKNMVYEFKKYHVLMNTEERRSYKRYFSTPDINGNFIIHKYDATNHNSEADYMNVTFVLQYDAPLLDGDLYVFGGFNNNQFNANNKMQYDYTDKTYKSTLYLKQGYYNYNYVFLPKDKTAGEAWFIEGMHWEAENDYNIFVYYRDIVNQYDKLIGFTGINSIKK